jgi:glycosyltransferase involved in cell wall biosynthesis
MHTKKVLMVIYNTPPLKSGAAKQALLLFNELKKDINIDILSIDSENINSKSHKRIFIGKNFFHKIYSIFYITWIISFNKYDVIHHISLTKYTFISVLLSKLFGKKVIAKMTMFNYDDPNALNAKGIFVRFKRLIYKKLNNWIAIAPGMVSDKYKNINFIPNAVDIPTNKLSQKNENIFLCSGVICKRKNQIKVLEFWKKIELDNKYKNSKLIFIGSFNNDYSEYDKYYVEQFLEYSKTFNNVKIIGHADNVKDYLKQSNFYISFSTLEGLSNSLLEALAYGLYPIVYDKDKNTLIKELYYDGYYFNDFNDLNFKLINTTDKNRIIDILIKHYSLNTIKRKYLRIYND